LFHQNAASNTGKIDNRKGKAAAEIDRRFCFLRLRTANATAL